MGRFDALLQPSKPATKTTAHHVEIPRKPENLKSGNPEPQKSGIREIMKTGKPENIISRKPEVLKSGIHDNLKNEKYSTLMHPTLMKRLKTFAIEHDIKDYEVLQMALTEYLNKKA